MIRLLKTSIKENSFKATTGKKDTCTEEQKMSTDNLLETKQAIGQRRGKKTINRESMFHENILGKNRKIKIVSEK